MFLTIFQYRSGSDLRCFLLRETEYSRGDAAESDTADAVLHGKIKTAFVGAFKQSAMLFVSVFFTVLTSFENYKSKPAIVKNIIS